nr:hypothetical protein [Tanacetum cinerariifolium]
MTTSSTNNSVFRGFFEKQKLIGPSFIDWYRQLKIVISIEDKLNYIKQPISPAPVAPAGQQVAPEIPAVYNASIKGSKNIAGLMQAEQELLQTTRDFHSCRQEEGHSVSSYDLKMKGYIDNLEHFGTPYDTRPWCSLILISLRKEYDGFVQNYNMHITGKTVNELHKGNKHKKSHSQTTAKGQNHRKGKNKQAYAPKPKIPPPPKRENPTKDSICHECGEIRHWKRNCPQYLAELIKKKKNTASGAGGSGVISVSRLYEDGFVNRFMDNTIQVSRNNVVYFNVIPRDGIFEIDLSNSLTNESSIYVVSNKRTKLDLDSALLWHCRLGHISKKRIEKLPHDGLLDSSDLTAFKKCVSCMSGKMARKPYIHQVERAKYLLGLIHTDVEKTPYEVWHGKAHKLSYLKVWGCEALVKRDTLTKPDKLEPRSIKCVFVGYPKKTMGYSFYYPPENKVLVAQNAEFLENSLIDQEAEIDEPQSDIVPIRRSTRTRHASDCMCLYIDVEEHELGDLDEPTNYKAALLDPESEKWLNAMNVEMQSMKDNEVWVLVELPPNGKTVAVSHTQTPGIDYEETFSPVADIRAIRILIAIVAYYDYEIWQMDVKTAFLNGYINKEVYMEQPEGFVNPKYPNRVCKLKRSIYALKQASRQWNKRFDDEIKKFGFTQNRDEPCVYLKASESNITFLILYVDDILIMGNSIPMLQSVKTYLGKCFAMKDLGEAAYIEKLKLSKSQGATTPAEMKRMQNVPYASAVGSIMYAMRCTRPDFAFTQNVTSRFQQNPGDLKRELRVSCYTDAGYLTDVDDLKSQIGYVFVLNGGAKILSGLGVVPTIEEPISMYFDNTGAIAIANESRITKGARHFYAKVHYLREVIEFGDIKLEKVHTYENLADHFTKELAFPKDSEHTRNIGMLPASSLM